MMLIQSQDNFHVILNHVSALVAICILRGSHRSRKLAKSRNLKVYTCISIPEYGHGLRNRLSLNDVEPHLVGKCIRQCIRNWREH